MTPQSGVNVLYLSYDGLTDPLGRSQILPYVAGLSRRGHRMTIVSCEKPARLAAAGDEVAALCRAANIEWAPIRYHKKPPVLSTMWDVGALHRTGRRLHRRRPFELVHCRAYIPAIAGLRLKREFGLPLLFDTRAFWADEKVEGGYWNLANPLFAAIYGYFKRKERELLVEADHVVVLAGAAARELADRAEVRDLAQRLSVIPCCVDFAHFPLPDPALRMRGRATLGIPMERPVLVYLGSLGGNYMLDEMLAFFRALRALRREALFLFITQDAEGPIRDAAADQGIVDDALLVRAAERGEVPPFLAAADLGVAFKRASFSAKACCPTKLGEMMAMGIPVVANDGVGDVTDILAAAAAGVTVSRFDDAALAAAAERLLAIGLGRDQIRAAAARVFELDQGVERYDSIYRAIAGPSGAPSQ